MTRAEIHDDYVRIYEPIEGDTGDIALVSLENDPAANAAVSSGDELNLAVDWDVAEAYVWFDPQARALSTRREAITITWYATGGSFASGRTGRAEAEADTTRSSNTWTAPTITGDAFLWIVVRDNREVSHGRASDSPSTEAHWLHASSRWFGIATLL